MGLSRYALLTLVMAFHWVPAHAQIVITSEVVGEPFQSAMQFAEDGDYRAAIEAMELAAAVPGIRPDEYEIVQQSILGFLVRIPDYERAYDQLRRMMVAGVGDPIGNMETCRRLVNEFSVTGVCPPVATQNEPN